MTRIYLIILLLFVSPFTFAETPSKESVVKLIKLTGADKMGDLMLDQMIPAMRQGMPNAPEGFFTEFRKEAKVSDLIEMVIPIYQKYLTQSDVEQLNTFYATDVGQKLIKMQPMLMQESMQVGQEWGKAAAQRASMTLQNKKQ